MSYFGASLANKPQTAVRMRMEDTAFIQNCSLGCERPANWNNKQTVQLF